MSYTYLQLAQEVLEKTPEPLKLGDIWSKAQEMGLEKKLDSQTPTKQALSSVLRTAIKRANTSIVAMSSNPTLFGLKDRHDTKKMIDNKEHYQDSQNESNQNFNERDLHPLFVSFADKKLGISCKTIFHEESKKLKKGQNQWLYPDIVGIERNPYEIRSDKAFRFLEKSEVSHIKLYSFELKKYINYSNFKASYFQALSNSSWAHYGYLAVFGEIEEEICDALKRLNSRFGIGVIRFGTDIESFEVVIPAKSQNLDPFMIDELARTNETFGNFLESVFEKGLAKFDFDEVLGDEELKAYIQKHKILE